MDEGILNKDNITKILKIGWVDSIIVEISDDSKIVRLEYPTAEQIRILREYKFKYYFSCKHYAYFIKGDLE